MIGEGAGGINPYKAAAEMPEEEGKEAVAKLVTREEQMAKTGLGEKAKKMWESFKAITMRAKESDKSLLVRLKKGERNLMERFSGKAENAAEAMALMTELCEK